MGNKIFISYKYADDSVKQLPSASYHAPTTARHYVNIIQQKLERDGTHINKGELDNEDLSEFRDDTIRSHLARKIFDSSVTIVLMSPNMREFYVPERDQWIPWEISYSLRLKRAGDNRSNRNGILLVYLPDLFGQYNYNDGRYQAEFTIIRRNQDNIKPFKNDPLLRLPASYFISCTWDQFLSQMHFWIANADRQRHFAERYDITIQVD